MTKLIAHLVTAVVLWLGLTKLGVPFLLRLAAILAGAVAVHFVWERFVFKPFLYLGARPVSPDDPLMTQAVAEAKRTWPQFVRLWPDHKADSVVRFRFVADSGQTEHLWGDAVALTDTDVTVFIRTIPASHAGPLPSRTVTVPLSDVSDWQIEFHDGTLRGGFTNRAMFKVFEREEGYVHPAFNEQIARFRDEESTA